MTSSMQISIRLPATDTAAIDELVDGGAFDTRTAFVTAAVRQLLAAERERQIGEMYRRAYADQPADDAAEWAANASRRAFADMEPYA